MDVLSGAKDKEEGETDEEGETKEAYDPRRETA
jgi:hypothetical protein